MEVTVNVFVRPMSWRENTVFIATYLKLPLIRIKFCNLRLNSALSLSLAYLKR